MKTLRWNLAENATRAQLLGDTLLQLPSDARERLEAAADAAGVPDRHHHDIGEVLATIDGLAVSPAVRDHMRAIYTILLKPRLPRTDARSSKPTSMKSRRLPHTQRAARLPGGGSPRAPSASWPRSAQTGQGEVECAHGTLSIPAPATSAIIARGIPVSSARCPASA